ncbi:MAG: NADPH-dependent F420 reductase [Vicinamibacterales bacterium]
MHRHLTSAIITAVVVLTMVFAAAPGRAQQATPQTAHPMKIGFIGSGNIGGAIGELLAKAGHEVFFSSRNPDNLKDLVSRVGPRARAGTAAEAIAFADVVFLGVPWSSMPDISRDYAQALAGKIVLDAGNPRVSRDGPVAEPAVAKGAGVATQEYLPKARIVRAFNQLNNKVFTSEAHRAGEKLAVPVASDDAQALAVVTQLVIDAGFEPVNTGSLADSKAFDSSMPIFLKAMTAREMREALKLPPAR